MKSGIQQSEIHSAQGLPEKAWHHESRRLRFRSHQQADAWHRYTAGVWRRTLREYLIRHDAGHLQVRHESNIQPTATNVQISSSPALANQVRYRDSLRSQTLCCTHLPASPYFHPWSGDLRDDPSLGHVGAVVLAFDSDAQALPGGHPLGFGWSQPNQLRHHYLAPMDGKAHGQQRRRHGHQQQSKGDQRESKKGLHQ
jgi:hypothetical protein